MCLPAPHPIDRSRQNFVYIVKNKILSTVDKFLSTRFVYLDKNLSTKFVYSRQILDKKFVYSRQIFVYNRQIGGGGGGGGGKTRNFDEVSGKVRVVLSAVLQKFVRSLDEPGSKFRRSLTRSLPEV